MTVNLRSSLPYVRSFALCALLLLILPAAASASADVSVMTRNMYVGANLLPLATSAQGEQFERAAAERLAEIDSSEPDARMKVMAEEIVRANVDFVNLQEATAWYTGPKNDPARSPWTRWDYLGALKRELRALGRPYYVVTSDRPLDLEGPSSLGVDVRFKTGNAILLRKRSGIRVERAVSGAFPTQLSIPTQAIGTVETTRGFNYVDFTVDGERARLVNAHPEAFSADIRLAQVKELVAGPLDTRRRVILAGDLNTGPDLPKSEDRAPYAELAKAKFVDRRTPLFNCCLNDDLRTGAWDHIVDRIMTRPRLPLLRSFIGSTSDTTPSGLLASDHGAVTSVLRLP
jgi:endonuclease/exonuclease/phosphatase family metal-dependent hydrolase